MEETPQSDISIFQVVVDNDDVEVAFLLAISGNKGSTRSEYLSKQICNGLSLILGYFEAVCDDEPGKLKTVPSFY